MLKVRYATPAHASAHLIPIIAFYPAHRTPSTVSSLQLTHSTRRILLPAL